MKHLIIYLTFFVSSMAYAGTGEGTVTCESKTLGIAAYYSWFNSEADTYSNLVAFVSEPVGNTIGKVQVVRYEGGNEQALDPISIKTKSGLNITVSPDLRNDTCTIKIN